MNIKFRVWDLEYKEMLHGSQYMLSGEGRVYCNYYTGKIRSFPEGVAVVQPFTSLKDKNGKEIYEGDVLRMVTNAEMPDRTVAVEWICFGFKLVEVSKSAHRYSKGFSKSLSQRLEIVGNIFQNGIRN